MLATEDTVRHRPGAVLRALAFTGVLAGVVAAGPAGCATGGAGAGQDQVRRQEAPVTLFVKNYNWSTVHVYVIASGQTVSMGQLSSMDTATYTLPPSVLGGARQIRLLADPVGSRTAFMSEPVLIEAGDRVEWTIQDHLSQSSVMVR